MRSELWWAVLAVVALGMSSAWFASARRLGATIERIVSTSGREVSGLAERSRHRDLLASTSWLMVSVAASVAALVDDLDVVLVAAGVGALVCAVASAWVLRDVGSEPRLVEERARLERRFREALDQDDLAPLAWSRRLAPPELGAPEAFRVGSAHEAGAGLMAGDFLDVIDLGHGRLASVIGDVAGHGIEPSMTALQTKSLLAVFLRRYRDPAQALEELNAQLGRGAADHDLVSVAVAVFDVAAGSMRFAAAGHPPQWWWHDREVRPLPATGPLLTLDPDATYVSREWPLDRGDMLVMFTDGLTEVRSGNQLFGEDRVADLIRRDPSADPGRLCVQLMEAARGFAGGTLTDDASVLAVRHVGDH